MPKVSSSMASEPGGVAAQERVPLLPKPANCDCQAYKENRNSERPCEHVMSNQEITEFLSVLRSTRIATDRASSTKKKAEALGSIENV